MKQWSYATPNPEPHVGPSFALVKHQRRCEWLHWRPPLTKAKETNVPFPEVVAEQPLDQSRIIVPLGT